MRFFGRRPSGSEGRRSGSESRRPSRGQDGGGSGAGGEQPRRPSQRASRPPRPRDPFGLDGELFEYLLHEEQHGEAFAGYRVLGHPMVLHSLVDGVPLASIHLRVGSGSAATALITRDTAADGCFQGVVTEDDSSVELVFTNLTTDSVIMLDVGGDRRSRNDEFWSKTDRTFWSDTHRNDRRLNASNILWPMVPNACNSNNLYYLEHGERRRLHLSAGAAQAALSESGEAQTLAAANSFPIYVYPKYGSRNAGRFARTAWSCPETILIVGSLSMAAEEHNIQAELPRGITATNSAAPPTGPMLVAAVLADNLGATTDRLLAFAEIDRDFFAALPDQTAHEVLVQQLNGKDINTLTAEDEDDEEAAPKRLSSVGSSGFSPADSASASASSARPAAVTAGERIRGEGVVRRLLIEKFSFDQVSQPASLRFAVHEELRLTDDAAFDKAATVKSITTKISDLRAGRREALLEEIPSVFSNADCVICLASGPDAIIYQCGHRCVHLSCVTSSGLQRCPLCRGRISAVLPVSAEGS
eukprot:TRINITY_DN66195_c0_g1_i1.p1 TRINITY_DN66195_c0_g1~~TRINITY_DN66195_c0_g1_i1.p1  ORF type:complete len:530 (-),score=68.00 TRINITY_DN66195_c0_g1_i1:118-1707(-)